MMLKEYVGIIILIWAAFEIFMMFLRKGNLYASNFNNIFVGISFFVFLFLAFLLNHFNIGIFSRYLIGVNILGLALVLCGFCLRIFAFVTLGKWFTPNVTLQSGQVLVQNGVYSMIRHPSYLGGILIYLGLSLLLLNWFLFIYSLVWFSFIYSWRIKKEENELVEKFGSNYREYQKRTKKLVPFVY